MSGSFLLGTNSIGSDIDLIYIVPGKIIKFLQFFGDQNTICMDNKCITKENRENKSFYCRLCEVF